MIQLTDVSSYVRMLIVTAAMGAIGGLISELIQTRRRNTGTLELPGRLKQSRLLDLGFFASALVGAVAALAVLYFFPPDIRVELLAADGTSHTKSHYELIRLIALALIVGSAGSSFLTSMQARILAALNAQKLDTVTTAAKREIERSGEDIKADVTMAVQSAIDKRLPDLKTLIQQLTNQPPPNLIDALRTLKVTLAESTLQLPDGSRAVIKGVPTPPVQLDDILAGMVDEAATEVEQRIKRRTKAAKEAITAIALDAADNADDVG